VHNARSHRPSSPCGFPPSSASAGSRARRCGGSDAHHPRHARKRANKCYCKENRTINGQTLTSETNSEKNAMHRFFYLRPESGKRENVFFKPASLKPAPGEAGVNVQLRNYILWNRQAASLRRRANVSQRFSSSGVRGGIAFGYLRGTAVPTLRGVQR